MEDYAKRNFNILGESNAIAALYCPEAEGLPGTAQFISALCRIYLVQALKRVRVSEAPGSSSQPETVSEVNGAQVTKPYPEAEGGHAGEMKSALFRLKLTTGSQVQILSPHAGDTTGPVAASKYHILLI